MATATTSKSGKAKAGGETNTSTKGSKGAEGQQAQSKGTSFLTLPPELRNRIYELALLTPGWPVKIRDGQNKLNHGDVLIKKTWRRKAWSEPGVLRASKEIRREAAPIYYGQNAFVVTIFMEDLGEVAKWLDSIIRATGSATPLLSLTLTIHGKAWDQLWHFLPLVQLIRQHGKNFARATGPEVRAESVRVTAPPCPPVFEMAKNTGRWIKDVFAEILQLGQVAHEEGWGEKVLEFQLELLINGQGSKARKGMVAVQKELQG